jgi:hypothetical protein
MQPTSDALTEAFHLLDSSVQFLCASGRRCLGARLKPELRRRSYAFSEQQLGFLKFAEFLRAAQRAGIIQLAYTTGGDLEVWPGPAASQSIHRPSTPIESAITSWPRPATRYSPPARPGAAIRVRDDLWRAFNSFSPQWMYDRNTDVARRLTDAPDIETGPDLVRIPAGRDRLLGWMRSFADTQNPSTKAQLLIVLSGESPVYQFKRTVVVDPNLSRAWREYHIQQTLAAIEAWSSSNGVSPRNITSPYRPFEPRPEYRPERSAGARVVCVDTAAQLANPASPPTVTTTQHALAPRLATLIDELIDELLRLRGALQVTDPRS